MKFCCVLILLFIIVADEVIAEDPNCGGMKLLYSVPGLEPLSLRYWATSSLSTPNKSITFAIVVQHGMDLNAQDYFCSAMKAVSIEYSNGNESILVIAPRFQQKDNNPEPNELFFDDEKWNCGGNSSQSISNPTISSFSVMDYIWKELLNSNTFPNLQKIVLIGHSAGGQFTVRYALGSRLKARIGVSLRYIVANPSTYPYLTKERPNNNGTTWIIPPHANCDTYNNWRYGLEQLNEYMNETGIPTARKQFYVRDVFYLLGMNDTCNEDLDPKCESHGLDRGCEAMLQGRWRLERGNYWNSFLKHYYNGQNPHSFLFVPGIGHDGQGMITSKQGRLSIFH